MADERLKRDVVRAMQHRARNGGHLHTSACIHNLPPEEQVEARGRTIEWWTAMGWPMPEQITPEQWECEPPEFEWRPDEGDTR